MLLTENEAKEWMEKVRGKKIRRPGWVGSEFVIPNGLLKLSHSGNLLFSGTSKDGSVCDYVINNGFESFMEGGESSWEWFDDLMIVQNLKLETKKEPHKCTCPKEVWLYRGCQCGGI